ncbi:MAG TPA: NFACT RNA binding domain-containing protein [Nitrososphaerales archaeon]|nr:NFACT RNA binding domain-containing protein [Nitrososphaerales archaeon]
MTKRISGAIEGYFLSGAYSMEDGALLRFNHASKPEKLVALSSFAPWITTKNLSLPEATKSVSRLRNLIERCEVTSFYQIGNERIAKFSFENRKGEKRNLYAEFFSHGNLILTDAENSDTILEVENPQTFRHRKLVAGEKYALPPTRGIALQEIDKKTLTAIFQESMKGSEEQNVSAIKWFGRNVGTSRKFVEEIFERTHTDTASPLKSMNVETVSNLAVASIELRLELEGSSAGYILIPVEDSDLEADVCPIVPNSWNILVRKKLAHIQEYPSLSEALDEVQIQALVLTKRRKASVEVRSKAEELASAIGKQVSQIESNQQISKELRALASSLMRETEGKIGTETVEKIRSYRLLEVPKESPNQLRFVTEPRVYLTSFNSTSLASRLFDEAKRLEEINRKLEHIMHELEMQKNSLTEQTKTQEQRAERKLVTDRRERQWFERYRWFEASDGRLVVGGRDATSNSIMINKYTNANDVVFHADLHGSPFFILGGSGTRQDPSDELALELAQATVGFSSAWKDELGSADAFWVFGDQVKKSAPSGEYLSRGSFFIDGKKNFVRHVKVGLSVGITAKLPGEETHSDGREQVAIVCGPEKSLAKYCIAQLKISPGKEKASDFARIIKQKLVSKIKDESEKEAAKKLSIDEIIRVLPSGGYRLVADE